ncbi:MAG: hypothetical protein NUV73_04125 [Candidatus Daviesbacteria bacterium]|nr:hypothetical protein [Candidatus Daviesbacteria bacterium]
MGNYGAKVSKEGFDVKTAADKDLVLKSTINIFKVSDDNAGTIVASGTHTTAHGLGVVPFFLAFMEDTAGKMRVVNGSGFITSEQFVGYANTTNVVLENEDSANAKKFYEYIHYDPQAT